MCLCDFFQRVVDVHGRLFSSLFRRCLSFFLHKVQCYAVDNICEGALEIDKSIQVRPLCELRQTSGLLDPRLPTLKQNVIYFVRLNVNKGGSVS